MVKEYFVAVMHNYRYGGAYEGESERIERIIDVDENIDALRERVNMYYARPDVVRSYRGQTLWIHPHKTKSNQTYTDGGGCSSETYILLQKAPSLK